MHCGSALLIQGGAAAAGRSAMLALPLSTEPVLLVVDVIAVAVAVAAAAVAVAAAVVAAAVAAAAAAAAADVVVVVVVAHLVPCYPLLSHLPDPTRVGLLLLLRQSLRSLPRWLKALTWERENKLASRRQNRILGCAPLLMLPPQQQWRRWW